jgi:hypothetical protein
MKSAVSSFLITPILRENVVVEKASQCEITNLISKYSNITIILSNHYST